MCLQRLWSIWLLPVVGQAAELMVERVGQVDFYKGMPGLRPELLIL
jgi:hypothetical protein